MAREHVAERASSTGPGERAALEPIRILEAEIGAPIADIAPAQSERGQPYRRARCLVRLHSRPLGTVDIDLPKGELSAAECAATIWRALATEIQAHLEEDGLPSPGSLDVAGLPPPAMPRCLEERERFLSGAPFASVVLATRDRPHLIAHCLDALLHMRYPSYEVILVDSASRTPATLHLAQTRFAGEPRLRYGREDTPGLARARNTGLTAVRGEIVAFVDDDALVDCYWLAELARALASHERAACVTGLIVPGQLETPAQIWFEQFAGFGRGYSQRVFDLATNRAPDPLYPYRASIFGTGCSMAFRTAFLRGIGGFDPALGAGTPCCGEDLAAFLRVITDGYQLVYEPRAILYHLHRSEYDRLRRQLYHYGTGLTGYLIASFMRKPQLALDLLARLPAAVYLALTRRRKYGRPDSDYPPELDQDLLQGMLHGPLAYLRSRWHQARMI